MASAASAFLAPSPSPSLSLRLPLSQNALVNRSPLKVSMCDANSAGTRADEIRSVLAELLEFRSRIVENSTSLAKKVKAKPKDLNKALEEHPDIIKIDQAREQLEAELKQLTKD
ncbi:hypothetical protein GUITHDRAFT_153192 [Guillardia theta CCMP2712]|uniref:Uncharacterized protein n=1 Tax=Guillardia theta (strain CCMP2712) TaxID=905079 RepID=L1J721_GUITC|nr:hypothetical protein GUITHDRAFT_153192 [Guillardia theta CCMP2712]EKX43875.1 hypothetical protein GUITHDRAFT_153192 [Guillardia theta CCMP2712]|eukprot:XP_005830855.1 hypothetical protein GUITHDRAFT_153192 [Guillardia theta CCMP2712]